jgi:hypothetical protein
MVLKQDKSKSKTYSYYVCSGKNPENRRCPAHRISKEDLDAKIYQQIRSRIDDVAMINEQIPSLDVSHINSIRKREMTKRLGVLRGDLELYRKCFRGLFEEFALRIYTDPDLSLMRQQYRQKCDVLEEEIQLIESKLVNELDSESMLKWLKLYKPFFSFEEVTRPLLAYLVRRITVGGDKEVQVEFLHDREFELLKCCIEDSG